MEKYVRNIKENKWLGVNVKENVKLAAQTLNDDGMLAKIENIGIQLSPHM